jgi:hypothetical protein
MRLSDINKTASILTSLDRQRHLMMSMEEPAVMKSVRLQRERQDQALQRLMEPVGFQAVIDQHGRTQRLLRSSMLDQLARQQAMLDQLVKGPAILGTLGAFSGRVPSTVAEQADQFRDELAAAAEAEEVDEETDPLPRLAAEREAILICLARIKESAIVAGLLDVPIPDVILALIVAAIVIGEVADEILREREGELAA